MNNFEYIGLFLTEKSKSKLKKWLINSSYQSELLKSEKEYLDHCTLIHKSQVTDFDADKFIETLGNYNKIVVATHIGISDKAMAFKVISSTIINNCINETPHITICTFNGGNPRDSNNITVWVPIKFIIIKTKLEKR